ncbi:hypothetical protein QL285_033005 [Trifolium repens]|nr:hypothetical protein QL285_033005 [Trifolium repens]
MLSPPHHCVSDRRRSAPECSTPPQFCLGVSKLFQFRSVWFGGGGQRGCHDSLDGVWCHVEVVIGGPSGFWTIFGSRWGFWHDEDDGVMWLAFLVAGGEDFLAHVYLRVTDYSTFVGIKDYSFRLNILWKRDVEEGSWWNGKGHLLQRYLTVGLASKGLGYKEKAISLFKLEFHSKQLVL